MSRSLRNLPLAVGLAVSLSAFAEVPLTAEQREVHLRSFDQVWSTIQEQHWDPQLGGVDWNGAKAELRPRVEKAASITEVRAVIQELIARLKISHVGLLPADVYATIAEGPRGSGRTGMDVRLLDGEVVVTAVDPGSPADMAGVKSGWIVRARDGKDLRRGVEKQPYLLLARMSGVTGSRSEFLLVDGSGRERTIGLAFAPARGSLMQFGQLPPVYVWSEFRKTRPDVGYIRFNLFMDPERVMATVEEGVRQCLKGCRGLVIDLRGNPGGIGGMAMGMGGWFVDRKDLRLGAMVRRDMSLKFFLSPRPDVFEGKLAILIDSLSASTSEILAAGLQDLKRARVFGSRSAGQALPSMITRLPNGDGFQYPVANYVSESGRVLEGRGVEPDVPVNLTRAALLRGEDSVLLAALEWMNSHADSR